MKLENIKLRLWEAFAQVQVPEFQNDIVSLKWIKKLELNDQKLVIDLVLPTFALRSEKEVAMAVKRAATAIAPTTQVELNVYADVKPAAVQSIKEEPVADVKNIILVASGKGGVGKSTVASNLAVALARLGCKVGLLDADVYGPSIPTMFGVAPGVQIEGMAVEGSEQAYMVPIERHGIKLMSIGFLVDTQQAMIWRGPMIASACMQLFHQVAWGDLDYLIVDLPPGTGDIQLTISQKVVVAGAVIVSTPQDVALADVVRAKSMFDRVQIPILGVVENMSYFVCDGCDKRHEIFTHGGAKAAASDLGLPFLVEVPLEILVRQGGDEGLPIVAEKTQAQSSQAFFELAHQVAVSLAKGSASLPNIEISGLPEPEKPKRGLPILG